MCEFTGQGNFANAGDDNLSKNILHLFFCSVDIGPCTAWVSAASSPCFGKKATASRDENWNGDWIGAEPN